MPLYRSDSLTSQSIVRRVNQEFIDQILQSIACPLAFELFFIEGGIVDEDSFGQEVDQNSEGPAVGSLRYKLSSELLGRCEVAGSWARVTLTLGVQSR